MTPLAAVAAAKWKWMTFSEREAVRLKDEAVAWEKRVAEASEGSTPPPRSLTAPNRGFSLCFASLAIASRCLVAGSGAEGGGGHARRPRHGRCEGCEPMAPAGLGGKQEGGGGRGRGLAPLAPRASHGANKATTASRDYPPWLRAEP